MTRLTAPIMAQSTSTASTDTPWPAFLFSELFWGLLILIVLVIAALIWIAVVRREHRRKSNTLAGHGAALDAWYRDLFDNAHDILLSLDPDGQLLALNRAGAELLGFTPGSGARERLGDLVVPADQPAFSELLRRLGSGTETAHGELEVETRTGRRVILRLNLRRQTLPGRAPCVQAVAWDVTEQRRAQEALRGSEQRLRHSLEERIRIGRDLHDGIIQSIYAVGLNLGECQRLITADPSTARRRLEQGIADLNTVIREVRAFIGGLEPEALKGREFRTAVESIAAGLGAADRLALGLEIDPTAANTLSARQTAHLLQIAREALSNTLRHSGARQARITLAAPAPDHIRFEIRDDGRGFDPARPPHVGLGLRNIESRALELEGRFELQSAVGQGTVLTLTLPVREPEPST
jgi:PAS domain S-box-containing protein